MSIKFSNTIADFLEWNQAMNLVRKLYDDKNYRISLLVSFGSFWGLRISDILSLRWNDIYNKDEFQLIEKKTQKNREIKINPQLKRHSSDCYNNLRPVSVDNYIFISQKGTVYSVQRINVILKDLKIRYDLKIKNFQ